MSTREIPAAVDHRLHPWSWLFVLLQQLRQFLLPLVALVVFGNRGDRDEFIGHLVTLGVVVALVGTAVLQYLTYRYRIGSDGLSIRSGILARNRREIPFARIHNVTVHQNVLHRLFGVAELRLESAGGDKPEAQMRVLRLDQALALEQLIRHRGHAPQATPDAIPEAAPAPDVLLALPAGELVRLGLVSNRALVVLAAAFGASYQMFPRQVVEGFIEQQGRQVFGYASGLQLGSWTTAATVAVVLVFALAAMRLLSIGLALLQYHDFRLSEGDGRLTIERGLLTRVRASAAPHRIQAWTLREGLLHRLFERRSLRIDIASGSPQDEHGRALKELVPIGRPEACDALINHVLPTVQWPPKQWQPVVTSSWWRLCLPALLLVLLASALASVRFGAWGLLPLLWLPWSAFKARRQVLRMGWSVDGHCVALRGGWWNRWWRMAELDKLQALQLRRSPLDRWLGTATLTLDTAGAGAGPALQLQFLPEAEARAVVARLSRALARRKLRW